MNVHVCQATEGPSVGSSSKHARSNGLKRQVSGDVEGDRPPAIPSPPYRTCTLSQQSLRAPGCRAWLHVARWQRWRDMESYTGTSVGPRSDHAPFHGNVSQLVEDGLELQHRQLALLPPVRAAAVVTRQHTTGQGRTIRVGRWQARRLAWPLGTCDARELSRHGTARRPADVSVSTPARRHHCPPRTLPACGAAAQSRAGACRQTPTLRRCRCRRACPHEGLECR